MLEVVAVLLGKLVYAICILEKTLTGYYDHLYLLDICSLWKANIWSNLILRCAKAFWFSERSVCGLFRLVSETK